MKKIILTIITIVGILLTASGQEFSLELDCDTTAYITLVHTRGLPNPSNPSNPIIPVVATVRLNNDQPITGVQFDIECNVTIDSVCVERSRLSRNHTFEYNGRRLLISSPSNQPLKYESGAIVYIYTKTPQYIKIKDIILTEPDETQHRPSDILKNVVTLRHIYNYIVGDANADGAVDAADYVVTANKIMERSVSTYYGDAADVNNDGTVNVVDLVGINNFTLGRRTIEYRNQ